MNAAHIRTVGLRLTIYMTCLVFCVAAWALAIGLLFAGCTARADLPVSISRLRWDIETSRPAPATLEIWRGETVSIEPRFFSYNTIMSIDEAYEIVLRYRSNDMEPGTFHVVSGELHTDAGRVRIIWTPAAESLADLYTYSIVVKSIHGDNMRAFGSIRLRGSVIGEPVVVPRTLTTLDFADVEILNAQDAPFLTDFELAALQASVSNLQTGKVSVVAWQSGNAVLQAAIDDAAAMANMGGDVTGPSTNAVVVGIRSVPVAELQPGFAQDGYGLKYNHATGQLLLGPVATEGTSISNLLTLVSTAQATDVPAGRIGMYRIIRPGNLPSAVINVNGAEIAWFDLLGMTMRQGSIHLLGSDLVVSPAAYDGSIAAPAYTWAAQRGLGKYRFSTGAGYAEGYVIGGSRIWHWDENGIHLSPGKQVFGFNETDPLSIHQSSTAAAWSNAGGTFPTNSVVATSPLLPGGVAAVAASVEGPMLAVWQVSLDGVSWTNYAATASPCYVRLLLVDEPPHPGDPTTVVTSISAHSWTRPDLVGESADTAGQVVLVDDPAEPRQVVNKRSMDAAVAAVSPIDWSHYPAQSAVRLDGHKLMLGGGWSLVEEAGLGYLSYADVEISTNGLVIANNGGIIMTAEGGLQGLNIAGIETDGSNVTINISTNGVTSQPIVQYTPSLSIIDWQSLAPLSETWPATTNGMYQVVVELPGTPSWFRAVRETGAARIDLHAPLYVLGEPVAGGLFWSGTNLLTVVGGVTNRVMMEVFE